MSKRSKYFYGILRIAAAYRNSIDAGLEEIRRFNYVYGKDDSIKNFNIWCFYPEKISSQNNGVTHFNCLPAGKPNAPQFHNLVKHGAERKD